jgi:hypothetical protein
MNRPLPPGDRGPRGGTAGRPRGHPRTVSGVVGLVGGVTPAAGGLTVGHRRRTFGPRSRLWWWVGVSAKAAGICQEARGSVHRSRKARRGGNRAGVVAKESTACTKKSPPSVRPGGLGTSVLRVDSVGALALFRLQLIPAWNRQGDGKAMAEPSSEVLR